MIPWFDTKWYRILETECPEINGKIGRLFEFASIRLLIWWQTKGLPFKMDGKCNKSLKIDETVSGLQRERHYI